MNTSAFVGVILGAVLATLGGFLATQLTIRIDRRRRTQTAALLFGDVLSAIHVLLQLVAEAPPPTRPRELVRRGLLLAIQREIDVYGRNRESLFEIPDAALRAKLHRFVVRLSVALEFLTGERALAAAAPGGAVVDVEDLESSLRLLRQQHADLPELLVLLAPYAGQNVDAYTSPGDRPAAPRGEAVERRA